MIKYLLVISVYSTIAGMPVTERQHINTMADIYQFVRLYEGDNICQANGHYAAARAQLKHKVKIKFTCVPIAKRDQHLWGNLGEL